MLTPQVCDYAHSKCCLCVFAELLDMIFTDIGRQLRVALTKANERTVRAKLNQFVLDKDFRHQFSKTLQSLFPEPCPSDDDDDDDDDVDTIRSYLATGVPKMDETQTDRALRQKIDKLVDEGVLVKPEVSSSTQAWLGDRLGC